METVGFIGLGNMGGGMAGNIQKAGYPMVVFDLREEATRPFLEAGARLGSSPADVAGALRRYADVAARPPRGGAGRYWHGGHSRRHQARLGVH